MVDGYNTCEWMSFAEARRHSEPIPDKYIRVLRDMEQYPEEAGDVFSTDVSSAPDRRPYYIR